MEINKTTVYTLTKEDIREVCYSRFVQKLKGLGVNAGFEVSDVKLSGYDDNNGDLDHLTAELKITEKENI